MVNPSGVNNLSNLKRPPRLRLIPTPYGGGNLKKRPSRCALAPLRGAKRD